MLRRAFTLIELLVVIAIIAILVALLLPAVQSVREAARRSQCQDHLHNLALAMHNYEGSHKLFPYASTFTDVSNDDDTRLRSNSHSWFVQILPYIEQKPLYDQIDFNYSTFHAHADGTGNRTVIANRFFPIATCPSNSLAGSGTRIDGTNFSEVATKTQEGMYRPVGGTQNGVGGPSHDCTAGDNSFCKSDTGNGRGGFTYPHRYPLAVRGIFARGVTRHGVQHVNDGLSNTLLLGEQKPHYIEYGSLFGMNVPTSIFHLKINSTHLANLETTRTVSWSAGNAHASYHPGGAFFAVGDGKVTFISENIDYETYCYLGDRNDRNPVAVP